MTDKRQKAAKVKYKRDESLTKQSIFEEYSLLQNLEAFEFFWRSFTDEHNTLLKLTINERVFTNHSVCWTSPPVVWWRSLDFLLATRFHGQSSKVPQIQIPLSRCFCGIHHSQSSHHSPRNSGSERSWRIYLVVPFNLCWLCILADF